MAKSQVQSRRFECAYQDATVDFNYLPNVLKSDENVSFVKWTREVIYIETKTRKTVSYFTAMYPALLSLIQCVKATTITDDVEIGKFGTPLDTRQIRCNSQKAVSTPEKLRLLYNHIRETKEVPDLSEDVTAILNKTDFDKVITAAKRKNTAQQYTLNLRPWQKEVLKELYAQGSRTVLWVFDFDGNSGKTELSKYLRYKCNYQKLPPGNNLKLLTLPLTYLKFYFILNTF